MSLLTDASSRRTEEDRQAARLLDQEYREHTATLDRYLAATFGTALSADEREGVRQQAFVGLASEIDKGTDIQSTEAMLITCARNAAYSLLRSADRRRRKPFDPQDSAEARLVDPAAAPVDVAVVEADENRRVKMLMDQLDERSRAVLQLRLELELDMPQIAEHLGVSPSHAYKLLKQAGRALADSIAANDAGAHSRQQHALLAACEMGTATEEQRHQAEQLLADPHARALLAEIRGLGHRAAAFMPPVVVGGAAPPSSGRISHMLSSAKQYVADLTGRGAPAQEAATQVATSGGLRGATPATIAVMCGAGLLGGGATGVVVNECVQAGGPAALLDVLPGAGSSEPDSTADQPEGEQIPLLDQLPVVVETTPATSPPPDPSVQTTPQADASQSSSRPTPTPATGGGSVSGLSGNPTPEPAPAPPPPPASSAAPAAPGGTGGSGSAGTAFGGGL